MPLPGNATISIRKKDLTRDKSLTLGFKKLVFAHKADAGEANINLSSLVAPSEMSSAGFVQPTTQELATAKLKFNRKNLKIISSAKGELMDYLSYNVTTNSNIQLVGFTAEQDEIFIGILDNEPETGLQVVDASPLVITGTLPAGQDEIATGEPFEINKYPLQQVGAVKVFIDGVQQFRNVGNATADPSADGNYQEVAALSGSPTGSVIKLNTIDLVNDRSYLVVSTGLLVNRPSASRDAALEALQATVDAMVPVLADAAGVPETQFQGAPSQADLKAFFSRLNALENYRELESSDSLTDRTGKSPVDRVRFDTSSSSGTYILPSSPYIGQWCEVWDSKGTFDANNLTINRNGHNIEGSPTNYTENRLNARIRLVYDGVSRGWLIGDLT